MPGRKLLLLIDAGAESMHLLASRVRRLGYLVVRAKTTEEAEQLLRDPRYAVSAAVIPTDLPAASLPGALGALRQLSPVEPLAFMVSGSRPSESRRRELAHAGVEFALWEPIDAHTLRFQINHAMAGHVPRASRRRALRAPASWPAQLRVGTRHKEARVYTISARGAFLATPAPAVCRSVVATEIPLPMATVRITGRVVSTNVPGNLMNRSLPVGMAVQFQDTPPETEALLQIYAEERRRALQV
jgi:CheY-like chemotaxis protein